MFLFNIYFPKKEDNFLSLNLHIECCFFVWFVRLLHLLRGLGPKTYTKSNIHSFTKRRLDVRVFS